MSSITTVELLAIFADDVGGVTIQPQWTLNTPRKPVALNGDIVALCDHDSETLILNWKTQEQALLKSPDTWQVMKLIHMILDIVHSVTCRINHCMWSSFLGASSS